MYAAQSVSMSTWRSRATVLMTIPHAIFLVALIVLASFIIATIRAEQSRQRKIDHLAQRCAFVYLVSVNETNTTDLAKSLASLNKHFRFDFDYKIVIVHDDMPPVMQGRLQAVSEAPLDFRPIILHHVGTNSKDHSSWSSSHGHSTTTTTTSTTTNDTSSLADHQSSTTSSSLPAAPPYNNMSMLSAQQQLRWTYLDHVTTLNEENLQKQHLTRFWFYTACLNDPTRMSPLLDFDYIVRLDSNWHFSASVNRDFLRDFVQSGAQYGFFEKIGKDCTHNSTQPLQQLASSYVELNGITPRSMDLWSQVIKVPSSNTAPVCLPLFAPQLEVINLRFFRSHSGIQDLLRVVDANGGIYTHAWKDSVLRFITVSLYAAREKITRYDKKIIPYQQLTPSSSSR